MSEIENRLAELAGSEDSAKFDRSFMPNTKSREDLDMDAMMSSVPIPGESLTNSPETPLPFERPPEFTDPQEFIEDSFVALTDPDVLPDVLESMRKGVPVELLAHKFLMGAFRSGKISPDLLMLSIEPMIYIMVALGTFGKVDIVLYPEEDVFNEDEEIAATTDLFKGATKDLNESSEIRENVTVEALQKPSMVSKSLLSRAQSAVENIEGGT